MQETIDKLNKEVDFYKSKFSLGDSDIAISGYLAYVKLVRQQVDFIKDFDIKANIDGKKAETVLYDRAISMGEGLPDMITKLNRLKMELKIEYDENVGKIKVGATTPQSLMQKSL